MGPIVVKANNMSPQRSNGLLLALGHISRVRELNLSTTYHSQFMIESYRNNYTGPSFGEALYFDAGKVQKSKGCPSMFGGDAPRLRHLEFTIIQ